MNSGRVVHQSVPTFAPKRIGLAAKRLAIALGLGSLEQQEPCHGYVNCCICFVCRRRTRYLRLLQAGFRPEVAMRMAVEQEERAA